MPGWWQTPLWQYAVYAVVIYSRAAGERLAAPVDDIARRIAARHGLELTSGPVVVTGEPVGRPNEGSTWPLGAVRRDQFMTDRAKNWGLQRPETCLQ